MELRIQKDDHAPDVPSSFGRYRLKNTLAVGRVSSVHLGLLEGAAGFRKPVAIKRLLPSFVHDPKAIADLAYEACVLAQIRHTNVVQALDLVKAPGASYLVMEYVLGETLSQLQKQKPRERCPIRIGVAIVADALRGLEAAHSARRADGQPLRAVHRNVCPDNLLVGIDGVTRLIDFGSALSTVESRRLSRAGAPDIGYAAPEQLARRAMDRRSDIFSMGLVLWELLTGKRMFGHSGARKAFLDGGQWEVFPPSAFNAEVQRPLDEVVSHAISWSADERFDTAAEFAAKLETALGPATRNEVAAWVEKRAEGSIKRQRAWLTSTTASAEGAHEPRRRESIPSFDDATVHFTPDEALLLSAQMDRGKGTLLSDADVLRTRLSRILDADPAGLNRTLPMLRTLSPWLRPARPGGRSLLTASAFVLLLLVGMRLSRETSGAAAAPVSREARPPVREAAPASRPVASPGIDVGSLPIAVARDDTPPEVAPLDREPIKRASTLARTGRSSCSPPFTLDAFGIKRIKLHCL